MAQCGARSACPSDSVLWLKGKESPAGTLVSVRSREAPTSTPRSSYLLSWPVFVRVPRVNVLGRTTLRFGIELAVYVGYVLLLQTSAYNLRSFGRARTVTVGDPVCATVP